MIYAKQWTQDQFLEVMRIARRHDILCSLRIAMSTRNDNDGKLECDCNGKIGPFGRPVTSPGEKTLADVVRQVTGGGA